MLFRFIRMARRFSFDSQQQSVPKKYFMFIDTPRRILFIHNPKTAGLAIAKAIGLSESRPLGMAHLTSQVVRNAILQASWDEFYSFCFVREPVARYYSLYHYQRSVNYGLLLRENESHRIARTYNFVEWLYFNIKGGARSNHFGVPQSHWYRGVKKVFRFEDMASATDELTRDLGATFAVEMRNQGRYPPLDRNALPADAVEAICDIDHDCMTDYYTSWN